MLSVKTDFVSDRPNVQPLGLVGPITLQQIEREVLQVRTGREGGPVWPSVGSVTVWAMWGPSGHGHELRKRVRHAQLLEVTYAENNN